MIGRRNVPFFKLLAVRIVFDVADHEVGEVTVFVREDVEETVWGLGSAYIRMCRRR